MKKASFFFILVLIFVNVVSCKKAFMNEDGLYVTFNTNQGSFTAKIFYDKVPVTAGNFVGLAEGNIEFTDHRTDNKVKRPFYNGLIFHRIIDGFMIQGGDPQGNGRGGPGYSFIDEFLPELTHHSEGILSMANSGSDTNGSQFFITLAPTPHLDGRHTVFGEIVDGMDIVKKIGSVSVDQNNKPYSDVFIKNLTVHRVGEDAKNFNAAAAFESRLEATRKRDAEREFKMNEFLAKLGCVPEKKVRTQTGLEYYILKEGSGRTPNKGDRITAHYTGYFYDGAKFDSSYDRNQPFQLNIGVGQVIKGWDEALMGMKAGEKRVLVIPFHLGYGERRNSIIPPRATLIFETEVLKIE